MTIPSIILGMIGSLFIGALFHLWVDGGPGRLVLFLVLSLSGFAVGQWIGSTQKWILLPVGPLDVGIAVVGSLIFLVAGYWLSMVGVAESTPKDKV